jgi:phosphoribosylcarboxyaminoimidazole (NCAIR) mutase
MALKKRIASSAQNQAKVRLSGMKSLSETLDLGDGVSVASLEALGVEAAAKLAAYNQKLSEADTLANELNAIDKELKQLSSRALSKVAGKYGRDSSEYEAVGGVRTSERKKPKTA